MTHIDPFAPGDSPQHPANWGKGPAALSVQDAIADTYQWRRDHLTMRGEADQDVAPEELEERHERYGSYLEAYGAPGEDLPESEFVAFPVLLRREVLAVVGPEGAVEWEALFEQHSTDDERDPLWVEDVLPDLAELRARAAVAAASAAPPTTEEIPAPPKGNALKEEWVEYALAVEKARGGALTFEEADAMTVADLKAAYKPQAS